MDFVELINILESTYNLIVSAIWAHTHTRSYALKYSFCSLSWCIYFEWFYYMRIQSTGRFRSYQYEIVVDRKSGLCHRYLKRQRYFLQQQRWCGCFHAFLTMRKWTLNPWTYRKYCIVHLMARMQWYRAVWAVESHSSLQDSIEKKNQHGLTRFPFKNHTECWLARCRLKK